MCRGYHGSEVPKRDLKTAGEGGVLLQHLDVGVGDVGLPVRRPRRRPYV